MADGNLDVAMLMNYTDSPDEFAQRIDPWLDPKPTVPLVPGLWFGRHRGQPQEQATEDVVAQIDIARAKTGNFCIFAYSSLFDSSDNELAQQNTRQRATRKARRDIVVPHIQALAKTDS